MKKAKSRGSYCSDQLLKLDPFSQEIEILFENNRRTLQTHCGVVFGFLLAIILISYGSFKSKLMVEYAMVHIQQPHLPSYFESNYSFERSKHGWNIAFGITAYDSKSS